MAWWTDFVAYYKAKPQEGGVQQSSADQANVNVSGPDLTRSYHNVGDHEAAVSSPAPTSFGRAPYPSFYGTLSAYDRRTATTRSRYDSVIRYYDANYCTAPATPVAAHHPPFQTAHMSVYDMPPTIAEKQQQQQQHSQPAPFLPQPYHAVPLATAPPPPGNAPGVLPPSESKATPPAAPESVAGQDSMSCASTVVPIHATTVDEKAKTHQESRNMRRDVVKAMRPPRVWFPIFSYISAIGMVAVFVVSVLGNRSMTGNVFEISPFNMMLGPSTQALVHVGAHYAPCMRPIDSAKFVCPDQTDANDHGPTKPDLYLTLPMAGGGSNSCPIQEICGMMNDAPNQLYRIATAPFVHAGILHLFLNLLVHLGVGRRIERRLNPLRYALVWIITGVVGYVTSTTFSPVASATMGCSASLFGIVVLLLVDLIRSWRLIPNAGWELGKLMCMIVLGLGFGYLPGPDNFAHVGGFIAGLPMAVIAMPTGDDPSRARRISMWIVRLVAFVLLVVACYLLLDTFYKGQRPQEICPWCKYLACLPVGDMCNVYDAIP